MGTEITRYIEHQEMLRVIDTLWMEHLESIDDLREGIGLRGYGQRDPLVEYKTEAFDMFERLMAAIDSEIVHRIYKIAVATPDQVAQMQKMVTNAAQIENVEGGVKQEAKTLNQESRSKNQSPAINPAPVSETHGSSPSIVSKKPGRNDPCWCGSGRKYKRCHYPN